MDRPRERGGIDFTTAEGKFDSEGGRAFGRLIADAATKNMGKALDDVRDGLMDSISGMHDRLPGLRDDELGKRRATRDALEYADGDPDSWRERLAIFACAKVVGRADTRLSPADRVEALSATKGLIDRFAGRDVQAKDGNTKGLVDAVVSEARSARNTKAVDALREANLIDRMSHRYQTRSVRRGDRPDSPAA